MKNTIKDVFIEKICDKEKIKNNVLNRKRDYMKKIIPILSVSLAVCIIFFGFYLTNSTKTTIDYEGYLKENTALKLEKDNLKDQIKTLYNDFMNDKISEDEYFEKVDNLHNNYKTVSEKMDNLKKEYKIKDDMDLEKVTFSKDTNVDKELKDLYKKELEIEQQEDEIDRLEESLELKYKNGQINKSEFKNQMDLLEKEEDKLDRFEDEVENEIDKIEDENNIDVDIDDDDDRYDKDDDYDDDNDRYDDDDDDKDDDDRYDDDDDDDED